ncbi:hypothetical protein FNU79_05835 [Deinococcus detaillensis]|uniref:Uncharacterized protein n=1 Tax=Deinococcus detaillensis TaxID=2592048 RepID=A0A553V2M6_9DEIO|nr:hypothetical protein [Deinococcus detaillensis]TSA86715.1 hypothetical protein FNU79_05835 [Deinococcus detaillensis]
MPSLPRPTRLAYVLRLIWVAGQWQISLQNVRTEEKLLFGDLAALLRYLEHLRRDELPRDDLPREGGLR